MTNRKEELVNAFNTLSDSDKITLWNDYCEEANMMDDQAIPVDQLEELYPVSSFDSVQEVIQMYSSITNDTGSYNCDYVTLNGYGYLVEFDVDKDIDVDELMDAVEDGTLDRVLPDELMEVMEETDE